MVAHCCETTTIVLNLESTRVHCSSMVTTTYLFHILFSFCCLVHRDKSRKSYRKTLTFKENYTTTSSKKKNLVPFCCVGTFVLVGSFARKSLARSGCSRRARWMSRKKAYVSSIIGIFSLVSGGIWYLVFMCFVSFVGWNLLDAKAP